MRKLASWLDGFLEYTEHLPSPAIFRRWSGISAISSALERKVWVAPFGPPMYANTYIVLCGPPGVGKTVATYQVQRLLRSLPNHFLASSSLTKAAIVDELKDSVRAIVRPGEDPGYVEFNWLSIVANELGVLIPVYDADFMSALTDIWDGHGYSERRRSKELKISMPAAQLNLLAGTTPSYLSSTLPAGAWDQGFISRTTVVFSGEMNVVPLFQKENGSAALWDNLSNDLKEISEMYGKMNFTEDAATLIAQWHMEGGPPVPDHPKLATYNTRRTAHLCKLCMIHAASAGHMTIDEQDFLTALDTMVFTERQMPDIFKAMTMGGDQRIIEDTWYVLSQLYVARKRKPIPESDLVRIVSERCPHYAVMTVINVMERQGIIEKKTELGYGTMYVPRLRQVNGSADAS